MITRCRNKNTYIELLSLLFLGIIIFLLSIVQVKNMLTIWNQNDEFGAWQGAAWVLGLDWSEVASENAFYGHGYGYLLAPFLYFFGNDPIKMTHLAVYFQAFYHTSIIFIAYYCINKLFSQFDSVKKIIISCISILTIPDLFYIYMFFSENLLRFLIWCIVGLVVSYVYNEKWYKLLLINVISIYAFSVHQRCILLIGISMLFFIIQSVKHLKRNSKKWLTLVNIIFNVTVIIVIYMIVYKYTQESYISFLYSASEDGIGGNLLSERGLSIQGIFDYLFDIDSLKIMFQELCGCIYYFTACDCGFALFGFINILFIIRKHRKDLLGNSVSPYVFIFCLVLGAILLTVVQNSQWGVSNRVEVNHYGRYFSYTLGPMVMLGVAFLFSNDYKSIKKVSFVIIFLFLFSGVITYNLINKNDVTSLFAFSNACPGINSVYFSDGPEMATLYHTLLGIVWILVPVIFIMYVAKTHKHQNTILVSLFCCIAILWIAIGNREAKDQYEIQKPYVVDTYDLQNILSNESEIAVFKSCKYGSGLIQYNNPYSKIYVYNELGDFTSDKNGIYVVSQNGIDEMNEIKNKCKVVYENRRYFIWVYQS